MTGKEMVELVQQHHPELGPQEIIKMLNRASDDYTARTRLLDSATKFTTVVDQRYYGLDDSILEIRAVDYTNDELHPGPKSHKQYADKLRVLLGKYESNG